MTLNSNTSKPYNGTIVSEDSKEQRSLLADSFFSARVMVDRYTCDKKSHWTNIECHALVLLQGVTFVSPTYS